MRVVIADDSMLLREGLARLLVDAGCDVVATAADAAGLLREVELAAPDAVIVDIRMPPTHTDEGIAAAHRIRSTHPRIGVLVLSQYLESDYAMRLITDAPEHVGYLLKERVSSPKTVETGGRRSPRSTAPRSSTCTHRPTTTGECSPCSTTSGPPSEWRSSRGGQTMIGGSTRRAVNGSVGAIHGASLGASGSARQLVATASTATG